MAFHIWTILVFNPNNQKHGPLKTISHDNMPIFGIEVSLIVPNNNKQEDSNFVI